MCLPHTPLFDSKSLPKFCFDLLIAEKFAKFRKTRKILEFQGASFTWQWERPRNSGQGESAPPAEG